MSVENLAKYNKVKELVDSWIDSDLFEIELCLGDTNDLEEMLSLGEEYSQARNIQDNYLDLLTSYTMYKLEGLKGADFKAKTYEELVCGNPDFVTECFWEFVDKGCPAYVYDSNLDMAKLDKGLALKNAMCDLGIKIDEFVNKHGEATAKIAGAGLIGLMANQNGKDVYDSAKEAGAFLVGFNYKTVMGKIHDFFAKQDNAFAKLMITDLGNTLRNVRVKNSLAASQKIMKEAQANTKENARSGSGKSFNKENQER